MPACMASRVISSSLMPIGKAPTLPLSFLLQRDSNSTAGQQLLGSSFQLKCGRKSGSLALQLKRNGPVSVRAEGTESEGPGTTTTTTTRIAERSEADKLVDGMTFVELCNEFECISSPAVEATARLLVKDILELREGNRTLATYAIFVKYKDPLRSFQGREKFKRPGWARIALDNPKIAVREMVMLSTSTLNIKWTLCGRPRLPPASLLGGDVVVSINSTFELNQISGQVTEQVNEWDLSQSPPLQQVYFWATRLSYSTIEAGKDTAEALTGVSKLINKGKDDDRSTFYPDPLGDPRKFFQVDDNPQKDIYQVGLVIALLYLLVQFLKFTL